jgi:hypothetical protein
MTVFNRGDYVRLHDGRIGRVVHIFNYDSNPIYDLRLYHGLKPGGVHDRRDVTAHEIAGRVELVTVYAHADLLTVCRLFNDAAQQVYLTTYPFDHSVHVPLSDEQTA